MERVGCRVISDLDLLEMSLRKVKPMPTSYGCLHCLLNRLAEIWVCIGLCSVHILVR